LTLALAQALLRVPRRVIQNGATPQDVHGHFQAWYAWNWCTHKILETIPDEGQPVCVREIAEVLAQRVGRPSDKRVWPSDRQSAERDAAAQRQA
jgi:hypothetical protein